MAKQPKQNKTAAGTDKNQVKQQNQQAAQGQNQYGAEFGQQTDAQQVREQNQKSQAKKK